MEERMLREILVEILRSELTGTKIEEPFQEKLTPQLLPELYDCAKEHDLTHIAANSLYKLGLLGTDGVWAQYSKAAALAVFRCEQQKAALAQICGILGEGGIPHIPLKGSVIRDYYPEPWMRTSCDIDLLVPQEQTDRAVELLQQRGFTYEKKGFHDISLYSPSNVHLELHFTLEGSRHRQANGVLNRVWDYALLQDNCRYTLAPEFFLAYTFVHMATHFDGGGCGLRSLMDLWVIEHRMGLRLESARVLLEEAGLWKFAQELQAVARFCFGDGEGDEFTQTVLEYITGGGTYGGWKNRVAYHKVKSGSAVGYVLRRIFIPYRSMKFLFPVLEKWPVLLPVYWVVRIVRLWVQGKGSRATRELKRIAGLQDAQEQTLRQMQDRLGLSEK